MGRGLGGGAGGRARPLGLRGLLLLGGGGGGAVARGRRPCRAWQPHHGVGGVLRQI